MAVENGTNAGFVVTAPVADPSGTSQTVDTYKFAVKDTSPVDSGKIVEIGWWCDNATEETNFEVGLYDHDAGNDEPDARLFVDTTNAKGTGSGWKTVTVDWEITSETIYWIAIQVDNTATATKIDYNTGIPTGRYAVGSGTTLPDPFSSGGEADRAMAIYAVWDTAVTYSELAGTIASTSVVSGNLDTTSISTLAGTIAATSSVSGNLGSTSVVLDPTATVFTKRLIVAGNNRIYSEDI